MRMAVGIIVAPLVGLIVFAACVSGSFFAYSLSVGVSLSDMSAYVPPLLLLNVPTYVVTVIISIPIFLLLRLIHGVCWWPSVAAAVIIVLVEALLVKLLYRLA